MRRLTQGQRIVAVVGLGVALFSVGIYVTQIGTSYGWVAYAPLAKATYPSGTRLTPLEDLLVWLGLVAAWVLVAMFVLRAATPDRFE